MIDLNEANEQFAIDIFKATYEQRDEDGDFLMSPLSIQVAMHMLINGADGETLEQIREYMSLQSFYPNGVAELYPSYFSSLASSDPATNLNISNVVFWDDTKMNAFDEFLKILETQFNAPNEILNFSSESALDRINDWASDATEERIPKVLNEIQEDEIMFLINALYFLGDWLNGFDENLTTDLPFIHLDGTIMDRQTMQGRGTYLAFRDEDIQVVEMPFKGEEYSMTFLTPLQTSLDLFINNQSSEELIALIHSLHNSKIQESHIAFALPTFETKKKFLLKEVMESMGMTDMFDEGKADLTRIGTAGGRLYVSRVIHDAFLKIDEKGAEGAAVTTIGIGAESIPPQFNFNQPFLYWIRHAETGTMVFMGTVE